jgi:hypothetical protein
VELKFTDYVRYNDDFCVFGDDKKRLGEAAKLIVQFLAERLHLKLSKCDLFPTSRGLDFVGYRHFPEGFKLVRKSTAKRKKRECKALPGLLESGKITPEVARSKLSSTHGWLKWANTHNLKKSMGFDALVENVNERCREQRQAEARIS